MPIATETFYQEMLDNAKNYNKRICIERRQRLPFLDSQTGVAQNHSSLVVPYRYRGPGRKFGQIYTYPSRRWKKKSSFLFNEYPLGKVKTSEAEVIEETPTISSLLSNNNIIHSTSSSDVPSSNNKILNYPASNSNSNSNEADLSNQQGTNSMLNAVPGEDNAGMAADWDMQSDGGEVENDKHQSDSSDYEETYVKKRKKGKGADKSKSSNKDPSFRVSKKGSGKGRGKKDKDIESNQDKDKPYSCDYCPMKYKTRPGLSYHVSHSHNKSIAEDDSTPPKSMPEAFNKKPMPQPPPPPPQHHISPPSYLSPPQLPSQHMQQQPPPPQHPAQFPSIYNPPMMPPVHMVPPGHKPGNKYCDFCLGDENENKKTGFKEEMVSCADCGRSGHPSCLQFSANMIISVKKYPWQCIECKSCGLCGTSDNDDQLLFCDDCDRGYHMYCLKPPLSEPPEGSWSCHLCINEFYSGSKEDSMSS